MKKLYIYMLAATSLLGLTTSCNDFGDVNVNPENPSQENMDYQYMFTQVQAQISGSDWDVWRNGCIYAMNMMQHTSSVNWQQGVFYTWNAGYNSAYWDSFYSGGRGAIRNIIDVMKNWEGNPDFVYEYQYARVLKAYMFQRMTDMYGDVPYFDAGKALEKVGYPKYDTQEAIYDDLLKELDEVNTELKALPIKDTASDMDVLYNGDSEKWRKFANSLMLRVAMRLSKVDTQKAQTYAQKALANGLFTTAADQAVLVREGAIVTDDSAEPFGKIISQEDSQAFYISEFFMNQLKANKDPRIHLIATKVSKAETRWTDGAGYDYGSSADISKLIGLPIGYTLDEDFTIYDAPGFPQEFIADKKLDWRPHYALVNRYTYARPDGPSFLVSYTENYLLLADAAARGLISGGNAVAKDYFKKGIEAAMQQFSYYTAAKAVSEVYLSNQNVTDYINSRLVAFDANPLKEINWEYYVTTFGDEYETFANWRRTGYPEISSVYAAPHNRPSYPNNVTNEIPRRFTYPTGEETVNRANYQEAVSRMQGGDEMSSRVWWDK